MKFGGKKYFWPQGWASSNTNTFISQMCPNPSKKKAKKKKVKKKKVKKKKEGKSEGKKVKFL